MDTGTTMNTTSAPTSRRHTRHKATQSHLRANYCPEQKRTGFSMPHKYLATEHSARVQKRPLLETKTETHDVAHEKKNACPPLVFPLHRRQNVVLGFPHGPLLQCGRVAPHLVGVEPVADSLYDRGENQFRLALRGVRPHEPTAPRQARNTQKKTGDGGRRLNLITCNRVCVCVCVCGMSSSIHNCTPSYTYCNQKKNRRQG